MKSNGGSSSSHFLSSKRQVSWEGNDSVESVAAHGKFPPPRCFCEIEAIAYISKTKINPNRAFYGCAYFKEKRRYCKFFKWVDEYEQEMRAMLKIEEGKIAQLERDMELMRNHMNEMQMKIKEVIKWEHCVGVFGVVLMAIVIGLCIWK